VPPATCPEATGSRVRVAQFSRGASPVRRNKPNLFLKTTLFFADHHKHLGVTFNSDGFWHKHIIITNIVSTASKILGLIKIA